MKRLFLYVLVFVVLSSFIFAKSQEMMPTYLAVDPLTQECGWFNSIPNGWSIITHDLSSIPIKENITSYGTCIQDAFDRGKESYRCFAEYQFYFRGCYNSLSDCYAGEEYARHSQGTCINNSNGRFLGEHTSCNKIFYAYNIDSNENDFVIEPSDEEFDNESSCVEACVFVDEKIINYVLVTEYGNCSMENHGIIRNNDCCEQLGFTPSDRLRHSSRFNTLKVVVVPIFLFLLILIATIYSSIQMKKKRKAKRFRK